MSNNPQEILTGKIRDLVTRYFGEPTSQYAETYRLSKGMVRLTLEYDNAATNVLVDIPYVREGILTRAGVVTVVVGVHAEQATIWVPDPKWGRSVTPRASDDATDAALIRTIDRALRAPALEVSDIQMPRYPYDGKGPSRVELVAEIAGLFLNGSDEAVGLGRLAHRFALESNPTTIRGALAVASLASESFYSEKGSRRAQVVHKGAVLNTLLLPRLLKLNERGA